MVANRPPKKLRDNIRDLRNLFRVFIRGKEAERKAEEKAAEANAEKNPPSDPQKRKLMNFGIPKMGHEEKTVFENEKNARPAVVIEKHFELKWKEGYKPTDKRQEDSEDDADFEEQVEKSHSFKMACLVMAEVRTSNMLEQIMNQQQNEVIRQFFEEGLHNPTPEIVKIFNAAMEACYNRLVYYATDYNVIITPPMRTFLLEKERAKARMLDVILGVPDFVPLNWGGQTVGLQIWENGENMNRKVAKVIGDDVKDGRNPPMKADGPSPWTNLMKEAEDQKEKKCSDLKPAAKKSSEIKAGNEENKKTSGVLPNASKRKIKGGSEAKKEVEEQKTGQVMIVPLVPRNKKSGMESNRKERQKSSHTDQRGKRNSELRTSKSHANMARPKKSAISSKKK